MLVNKINTVQPPQKIPKLPVAHALWEPLPNLQIAAAAWIYAGGAHHTVYSQAISTNILDDYANMLGIEMILIDQNTELPKLRSELKTSSVYYSLISSNLS